MRKPQLSAALAELLSGGKPWRQCREAVLEAYPAQKRQRRERFAEVMAGLVGLRRRRVRQSSAIYSSQSKPLACKSW